ncbi:MAG: pyridoxal phosphate-dependent aminotransferase [Leptospirillum sp.]|jgi:aspartate aminotransferase|nr:pyridoxal phosphate-dependent aminotransferase [Nitrospiraceae bacterium]
MNLKYHLADRLSNLKPSPTLKLASRAREMKAQGIDVRDFTGGEPDFDTPEPIKDAAILALRSGFTKYTAVGGIPELKAAIIEKFERDQNISYKPSEIVVSSGAKHSLFQIFQALVNPGDHVLLPTPAWVSYPDQILLNGGEVIGVPCYPANGFRLQPEALLASITPRSRVLVLNSPNNPSGAIIPKEDLLRIAEIVKKHNLIVISDEIYEKIVFDGRETASIASLDPELRDRTVIVNGVSKTYAMTGWRIGYAAGPAPIIEAVETIQSQTASNPTSIAQKAAVVAIKSAETYFTPMLAEYTRRRQMLMESLNAIDGIRMSPPDGAFYAFPDVSGLLGKRFGDLEIRTVTDLSEFFLAHARVALVPGSAFGSDHHMRMSFATSPENLAEGVRRLKEACSLLS